MTSKRGESRTSATIGETVLADSNDSAVVREVGYGIYEPVVYFPRDDIAMDSLVKTDKSTFCPPKGNTEYFDLVLGDERITDAAWSYVDALEGLPIRDLVAFDGSKVTVIR